MTDEERITRVTATLTGTRYVAIRGDFHWQVFDLITQKALTTLLSKAEAESIATMANNTWERMKAGIDSTRVQR